MGTWGTGIYQNDVSEDVKDDYISKLKAGKSDEEALNEILQEYDNEINDIDEKYNVFFGLADTLWKKGRLTAEMKQFVLNLIEEEEQSDKWETEKIKKDRQKALNKLKEKLNSEMPARKKIAIHKPYVMGWEAGDVYTFQIKSKIENYEEYVGWYVLFYVDKIIKDDWQVKGVYDEVAEVYFFLTKEKPKDANEVKSATPVCFLFFNDKNQYRAELLKTSKRQRPKDMLCLGKCSSIIYPQNEFLQKRVFYWNLHERDILWRYGKQIKYEKQLII